MSDPNSADATAASVPLAGAARTSAFGTPLPDIAPPSLSLPKAGGAIRGIGEKFSANPATGTGSTAVPIATSPGRSGFGPQLSLSYDSGRGNGPFGFGWSLTVPTVTRRTDKGLPRFDGSDVFLLSDAEDLVPALAPGPDGAWAPIVSTDRPDAPGYRVERYRPRVEGLFARIERWTRIADGDTHWRSVTGDGVTHWYGQDSTSRVLDPVGPERVFSWLLCRSEDGRGNAISYEYLAENGDGVDPAQAHERHRGPADRAAHRHLKRIRYGNRVSTLVDPDVPDPGWAFEVVLDYGDHEEEAPTPLPDRPWASRPDPFSSYRAGFEVRTYRLCARVLMFHHFPTEDGIGAGCLVGSTDIGYTSTEVASMLTSVAQRGYRRDGAGYLARSMPPVEFGYTPSTLGGELREVDPESLANLPAGVGAAGRQWADLDGEGIPGVLATDVGAWSYKPNLGDGRLGPMLPVPGVPTAATGNPLHPRLLDVDGNGRLDVVTFDRASPGYLERAADGGWQPWRAFDALPTVDLDGPDARFVDLDGDGHADLLVAEGESLTWYPSTGGTGFGPGVTLPTSIDEDTGPLVVFADGTSSLHLADATGDGLTDLVRIRNGEVCYWPNLGHGRFGARVSMDDAPRFASDELFDQRNLRLADVDGSGPFDLLYFGADGVQVHLNRSGNVWAPPVTLTGLPVPDAAVTVDTVDLLGAGSTCLVWSSTHADDAGRAMRYADLTGGVKPHLLERVVNNLGAETLVRYAPSTRYYLADRAAGRPWLTRLPFPVQVVERVETYDRVSHNRFVTRYAYHHGYFDGLDREFRGFGMTEQWDTEELAVLGDVDLDEVSNEDPASHVPPVLTRTWTHTGAFLDVGASLAQGYAAEYWPEPGPSRSGGPVPRLPDTVLLADGTRLPYRPDTEELREACRALKGSPLRQEIYALDGSPEQDRPYLVTESGTAVELLQPMSGLPHAVCLPRPAETVTRHHERRLYDIDRGGPVAALADPRVTHDLVLDVDGVGNVLRGVSVAYGRRYPDADLDARLPSWALDAVTDSQTATRLLLTVNGVTNAVDDAEAYRTPLPCESRVYELIGVPVPADALLGVDELRVSCDAVADGAHDLPYEHVGPAPDDVAHRRLVEHVRTLYRRDDLTAALPLGWLESLGLTDRNYRLALTPGLVALLPDPLPDVTAALGEGSYLSGVDGFPLDEPAGLWWVPSGVLRYSPGSSDSPADELAYARAHFFLPGRSVDPFGNVVTIRHDEHDLLPAETTDPLGNRVSAENDYRVLAPRVVSDPNRNRAEVAFDALGTVTATAVTGKPGEDVGDSLDGLDPDPTDDEVAAYLADPLADPHGLLGTASSRLVFDLFAYARTAQDPEPQPAVVASLTRETHVSGLGPGELTAVQYAFAYSDGFGREIQRKALVAPGPLVDGGPVVDPRWVGSGWTIVDNKGNPVRQYEPFFTATYGFEFARIEGVSPILCYDPVGRVVLTLNPDHTWEKVVVDPWRQQGWDVNDTVLDDPSLDPDVGGHVVRLPDADYLPTWHAQRSGGAMGALEQTAAAKAGAHADTPGVTYLDPLSRAFLTVAHNRSERPGSPVDEALQPTRVVFDIEGNQRSVVDALGRIVMTYDYDMLGNPIRSAGMEAGHRWMLADVTGQALHGWDSRDHRLRTSYDELRRPTEVRLRTGDAPELLVSRTVYGESPDAVGQNLLGRPYQVFDGAGVVTTSGYDFTGNPLSSTRRLALDYTTVPDWSGTVPLEPESFTTSATFDALNRPVEQITPDDGTTRRTYAQSGALATVEANLRANATADGPVWTRFVTGIDYDAKGRRRQITYGNGVVTTYRYDPLTFRLIRLQTLREGESLQDLSYVYDPAGNITHIQDDAQQTVFFRNTVVEPSNDYLYDATYQLIEATGREHLGQTRGQRNPPTPPDPFNTFHTGLDHPGDGNAMGRYTERYLYDAVGNFEEMQHEGSDPRHPGWTRTYRYAEESLLEAERVSNRLTSTQIGNGTIEPYEYDAHGGMTSMVHLPLMRWNHLDQLDASSRQLRNDGTSEITYYVYDGSGQRVRKVTENSAAAGVTPTRRKERLYLGGFELYREYSAGAVSLERETLHIMDDTQRIAMVETRTAGEDGSPVQLVRYQLADHLGSSALEVDRLAQVISFEEYFPYGATSYQAVRGRTETPNRYRYTGIERDEETGLAYHGARYYAPSPARWVSVDPVPPPRARTSYGYASANPVGRSDPDGLADTVATMDEVPVVEMDEVHIKGGMDEAKNAAAELQHFVETSVLEGEDYLWELDARLQSLGAAMGGFPASEQPTVRSELTGSDSTYLFEDGPSIHAEAGPMYGSPEEAWLATHPPDPEGAHTELDIIGLHPSPVGVLADLENARLYLGEGRPVDAAISSAGTVFDFVKLTRPARVAGEVVLETLSPEDAYAAKRARDLKPADRGGTSTTVRQHFRTIPAAAGARLDLNLHLKPIGNNYSGGVAASYQALGFDAHEQVTFWTPHGPRVVDVLLVRNGRIVAGIEAKVGSSRYSQKQYLKDQWILQNWGFMTHVSRVGVLVD